MELPEGVTLTVSHVINKEFKKGKNYKITDWDLDRIILDVEGEPYHIRTWDITDDYVRWTLFKEILEEDGSGYGEPIGEGVYNYSKNL